VIFFLQAIGEQFRKFANMYFLIVGCIMATGYYTELYESAISPWTTLGPLAFVVSVSLLVEGAADKKRHKSDDLTNNAPCIILRRADEIDTEEGAVRDQQILGGKDVVVNLSVSYAKTSNNRGPRTPVAADTEAVKRVKVGFQSVRRMDIQQGHLILVKNREMVPADMVLLASSGDSGSAYIETSSIDGETNLKLRTSPHLPQKMMKHLRDGIPLDQIEEVEEEAPAGELETLEQAAKRITRFSCLAYPDGVSALKNPSYTNAGDAMESEPNRRSSFFTKAARTPTSQLDLFGGDTPYVAALTSEPPNPHVNTFSGKLTLPPAEEDGECLDIALGADNLLLRGAVLRNTEWVIGLSCFTGTDTKLVQNSFETPSKFSQLDRHINSIVLLIIIIMILIISYLASQAVVSNDQEFNNLWYIGLNSNTSAAWPYLPDDLPPPDWDTATPNWLQMFFLYVTLLSNFVPLSMYVTVEAINFFFLYLIYVDNDMYDAKTDTRAVARSTNVTDLGQVQYVFSDKTGTLTQNVMRFKRCSVDGLVFGAPIARSRPGMEEEDPKSEFHPARHLLVGRVNAEGGVVTSADGELTFNSEMFLRVLSLCHTVVVEKDLDLNDGIDAANSVSSHGSSMSKKRKNKKKVTNRNRTLSEMSDRSITGLEPVSEDGVIIGGIPDGNRSRATSAGSLHVPTSMEKANDGAPIGYAYQAESPDEGALVSAASNSFGFQVVGRDSSGIKLRCAHPTIFTDEKVVNGVKSGAMTPRELATASAAGTTPTKNANTEELEDFLMDPDMQRMETWTILAVNKFDSERKRMSILLRSPPEFGSIPMLLCKGADSAMLDPTVCTGAENLVSADLNESQRLGALSENYEENEDADDWEMAQMLGIQSHLGEFASEGLRTLVLGVRFLTEAQCEKWLDQYKSATTSIKDREQLLREAAYSIERQIHIVGATAIEDKLQVGVPRTIATLGKAGIKLWVLTGDKRETAIEIGYSTNVLTSKMHLTEVADEGPEFVRAQCAMEFIRLVKQGKLPSYQRAAVDQSDDGWSWANASFALGKFRRSLSRGFRSMIMKFRMMVKRLLGADPALLQAQVEAIRAEEETEKGLLKDVARRRNVRNRAEKIVQDYLKTPEGQKFSRRNEANPSPRSDASGEIHLSNDEVPGVFGRAQSARQLLEKRKSEGKLVSTELRNVSLAQLTAQEAGEDLPLIDEDTLSLNSFVPTTGGVQSDFDRRRRTILERLFAVDRSVRKGKLIKHLKKDKRQEALSKAHHPTTTAPGSSEAIRALVIEGNALKYLLGDVELEELIFAIASKCDAVIACRVSPRQKALLVKLVRHHVVPEPVTLAIGDGANDVGMIQEAHVGVGISGKEGKQAVNASDFAIAQFRFLETLLLIHGRWGFFRLSTVVMFSFYKNAVMAGCLVVFNGETLFSGTPLFDEWIIAVLNFVAGGPITLLGLFDRCLDKEYIRRNPEVYQPTRDNELITFRSFIRWVVLTFGHIFCLYYGSVPQLADAGGVSSAFSGLMTEGKDNVGDGEGGDLQSVGTVTFTCMVLLLAYKVSGTPQISVRVAGSIPHQRLIDLFLFLFIVNRSSMSPCHLSMVASQHLRAAKTSMRVSLVAYRTRGTELFMGQLFSTWCSCGSTR
jgi:magnesium-transporting ATPase (P-type)